MTAVTVTDAASFQAVVGATDTQMADLRAYAALLATWNTRLNLVGPSAMGELWPRHMWDSAQLLTVAPDARRWADVGAGAGFPGIVLAVLLKTTPSARIHLIESQAKRCRFLEEVVRVLDLPAVVLNRRAEDVQIPDLQVVTARACAPMIRLLEFVRPMLTRGVTGIFLKGRDVSAEVEAARRVWRFEAEMLPSRSSPEGWVVKVERLSRVKPQ